MSNHVYVPSLQRLPKNILWGILRWLNYTDIVRFGLTCKIHQQIIASNDFWKWLCKNAPNTVSKIYNFPKLTEKEESIIDNWRFAYRVFVEDRLGNWEWEFTQMFGEEENESEDSASDNGEGNFSCSNVLLHTG
jgi:hypothetical protein